MSRGITLGSAERGENNHGGGSDSESNRDQLMHTADSGIHCLISQMCQILGILNRTECYRMPAVACETRGSWSYEHPRTQQTVLGEIRTSLGELRRSLTLFLRSRGPVALTAPWISSTSDGRSTPACLQNNGLMSIVTLRFETVYARLPRSERATPVVDSNAPDILLEPLDRVKPRMQQYRQHRLGSHHPLPMTWTRRTLWRAISSLDHFP